MGSNAAALGPSQTAYFADWLKDRLDGKPMQTKHMKVDANGQIHESTFEEARKAFRSRFRFRYSAVKNRSFREFGCRTLEVFKGAGFDFL